MENTESDKSQTNQNIRAVFSQAHRLRLENIPMESILSTYSHAYNFHFDLLPSLSNALLLLKSKHVLGWQCSTCTRATYRFSGVVVAAAFFPVFTEKKQAIQAFHKQCEGKPLVEHIQNVHLYANEFTKYTHTQRIRYGKCSISLRRFQSIKFIHLFWYSMRMNFGNFLSVCQK